MKNSWMANKKVKNLITIVVAIAVMIGMVIPTVAMEDTKITAETLAAEEALADTTVGGETNTEDTKQEPALDQEEVTEPENTDERDPIPEETKALDVQEEEIKSLLTPGLTSVTPQDGGLIVPFDIIDLDETMIYPGVRAVWYDKNGVVDSAPAGASITVVLMDKGPQDSYADWAPSQNRLGTSKNTEVLNAGNDFDGWFDNIIKMRSKKIVVSGVPSGYTVTYDDNSTSNEYPSGYDPEFFYINLTKNDTTEATLSKIEVTTPPSRTAYTEGESFDKAGMVVTATYSDNSSKPVTTYTYSPSGTLTSANSVITVSYTESGVTRTATTPIMVYEAPSPELDSIEVTKNPNKTVYTAGESFDPTGLEVTAHYTNDGPDKVLTEGEYTLSTPDMSTEGTKNITVTYEESGFQRVATFQITVNPVPVVLDSIAVTTPPAKTVYTEGESFDKAGMVVTATYSDGTATPVTGYTYSPSGGLTISNTAITVSYMEGGVIKTAATPITVNPVPVVLDSIAVTTPPAKTVYTEGESFDKAGMVVTATYSDGTATPVTGYTYSPSGGLTISNTAITVSYMEGGIIKIATTPITVNPVPVVVLDSIAVTTPPTKTEYAVGEDFDPSGMEVTAHYTNGGTDRILGESEYTIDPVDMTAPGTKHVVIRHADNGIEKTHSFTITVSEALQPSPEPTEPTETVDPEPEATTAPEPDTTASQATVTNESDNEDTTASEVAPKTGEDDTGLVMSIVFIAAAFTIFISLVYVTGREKKENRK